MHGRWFMKAAVMAVSGLPMADIQSLEMGRKAFSFIFWPPKIRKFGGPGAQGETPRKRFFFYNFFFRIFG